MIDGMCTIAKVMADELTRQTEHCLYVTMTALCLAITHAEEASVVGAPVDRFLVEPDALAIDGRIQVPVDLSQQC